MYLSFKVGMQRGGELSHGFEYEDYENYDKRHCHSHICRTAVQRNRDEGQVRCPKRMQSKIHCPSWKLLRIFGRV